MTDSGKLHKSTNVFPNPKNGVCSNLASSGEPPASQYHFNHCTCPFCPPVEAMHAVIIMTLKAIGPTISVGTVLTSRQVRYFSLNFIRTTGSEVIKIGRANTYFRPLASKSGGAFVLPALQLVPPLDIGYESFNKYIVISIEKAA